MKTFEVIEATPPRPIQAEADDHPDILDIKKTDFSCGVPGIEYLRRSAYIHIQQDTRAQERLTEFMNEFFKASNDRQLNFEIIEPPDSISIDTPLRRLGKAALRNFHFDRVMLIDPKKIMQEGCLDSAQAHLASANVPYPEGKVGLALVDYSEEAQQILSADGKPLHKVLSSFVVPTAYVQPVALSPVMPETAPIFAAV